MFFNILIQLIFIFIFYIIFFTFFSLSWDQNFENYMKQDQEI